VRLLTFFIFTVPLLSCTTINRNVVVVEKHTYHYIDSEFDPIIKSFVYEAGIHGHEVDLKNLSVTFGNVRIGKKDTTVGYCVKSPVGGMVIKIHKPTWGEMTVYKQEQLIFHELAHCLMGRDHCNKETDKGPLSIMNTHLLSSQYYKDNREELLDELFNVSPECVGNDVHADEVNGKICSPTDHRRPI